MAADMEDRIAKLLAKAEGTTNPHEAEAFMAKAEELMLKFGIDRANLEAKEAKARGGAAPKQNIIVKKVFIPNGHGYAAAMVKIAHAIAPSFSIRSMQSRHVKGDGSLYAWLVGHENDVQDCATLLESLITQSRTQAIAWWRNEGKPARPWASDNDAYLERRDFIEAFGRGAGSRLHEIRNRVVAEATVGTELVLVDRRKAVDSWVDDNITFGKGRSGGQRTYGSGAARGAGYASGREAVSPRSLK